MATRTTISMRTEESETFIPIAENDAPAYLSWPRTLCRKAGFRPKVTEAADSIAHLEAMVTADHCAALLPRFLAEKPAPGLAVLSLKETYGVADLLVIWQRGKMTEPVRQMLDALFAKRRKIELP